MCNFPVLGAGTQESPKRLVTSRHHEQPALSKRIKTRREVGNLGKCAHIYDAPRRSSVNPPKAGKEQAILSTQLSSAPKRCRLRSSSYERRGRFRQGASEVSGGGGEGEQRQEIVFRKPLVPRPRSQWALAGPPGPGRRPRRPCPRSVPRLPYLAQ